MPTQRTPSSLPIVLPKYQLISKSVGIEQKLKPREAAFIGAEAALIGEEAAFTRVDT